MSKIFFSTLFFISWLFVTFTALSQRRSEIDSLKAVIATADDTTRINALFHLSMVYQNSLPDSAMYYVTLCKEEADELGYKKGQGDALISRGRLKRDKGKYDKALEDIFASLEIYKSIKDSVQIANAINDISIVYAYSDDAEKSLSYFIKALSIFKAIGDSKGESQTLNNIGLIYLQMDSIKMAEQYMLRSLEIKKRRKDTIDIASGYGNLGKIMEETNQIEKALTYYLQSQALYIKSDHKIALAENYLNIAHIYMTKNDLKTAKVEALKALSLARATNSAPSIIQANSTLIDIAELRKDYERSYGYLKLNVALKDSLQMVNNNNYLQELKEQYNSEERENEIALLQKDRQLQQAALRQKDLLTYSLIVVIVLIIIIGFLLYHAYRTNKHKKDILIFKNARMASQRDGLIKINRNKDQLFSIISHDVRSPLNSLKGFSNLLVNHLDTLSEDDIQHMGKQINQSLDNLTELLDNLLDWSINQSRDKQLQRTEVNINELIRKNVELYELTVSAKDLKIVDYSEEDVLAKADYNSVHTVLRNLIANAIKFSYPGNEIKIKAVKQEEHIEVSVKDDGIGMTDEGISKLFDLKKRESQTGTFDERGSGLGLILCQELIRDNFGELYVNSELKKGSTFTFTLPCV